MATMQVETLDILTQKGRFDTPTARAIAEAIDLEVERSKNSLVTKQDLFAVRGELESKIAASQAYLEGKITDLRTSLEYKLVEWRATLEQKISDLRVEMHAMKAELVRWVFVAIMGQVATLTGLVYFLIKYTH